MFSDDLLSTDVNLFRSPVIPAALLILANNRIHRATSTGNKLAHELYFGGALAIRKMYEMCLIPPTNPTFPFPTFLVDLLKMELEASAMPIEVLVVAPTATIASFSADLLRTARVLLHQFHGYGAHPSSEGILEVPRYFLRVPRYTAGSNEHTEEIEHEWLETTIPFHVEVEQHGASPFLHLEDALFALPPGPVEPHGADLNAKIYTSCALLHRSLYRLYRCFHPHEAVAASHDPQTPASIISSPKFGGQLLHLVLLVEAEHHAGMPSPVLLQGNDVHGERAMRARRERLRLDNAPRYGHDVLHMSPPDEHSADSVVERADFREFRSWVVQRFDGAAGQDLARALLQHLEGRLHPSLARNDSPAEIERVKRFNAFALERFEEAFERVAAVYISVSPDDLDDALLQRNTTHVRSRRGR
ncbi:uncharacterized protein JCM10292_001606 [Rhodotorula paludigena]|uniref:uncharacterized protein n=1 Tax=Rhodotorula paludigena TaxID=86838 RepID=UPI003174FBE4